MPLTQFPPLLTPYISRILLSKLRNRPWYVTMNKSPGFSLDFTSFSVNALLPQDPIQVSTLHLVTLSLSPCSVTISHSFLVLNLDCLEELLVGFEFFCFI